MPRAPPVTSATLPSRAQKTGSALSGKHLLELGERSGVAHRDGCHGSVAATDETGQHLARTNLDEQRDAVSDERGDGLGEANRGGQLLDQQPRQGLPALEA